MTRCLIVGLLLGLGIAHAQVAPSGYSVNLTWSSPTNSTDLVASYAIFRCPGGGSSFRLIGTTGLTSTVFTDNSILIATLDGATWNYMVESVDANGVNSAPSNVAVVSVPTLNLPPTVGKATVQTIP